jgi:hypothetical protein
MLLEQPFAKMIANLFFNIYIYIYMEDLYPIKESNATLKLLKNWQQMPDMIY